MDERPDEQHHDALFEARIVKTLHDRAQHVHFTPEMRQRVMQRLPSQRTYSSSYRRWLVAAVAATFVVLLAVTTSLLYPLFLTTGTEYTAGTTQALPAELARGGQLVSLDPTEHYMVYQAANQPGVMYTIALADPLASNTLAMRNALDAAWAPDGSALVATIAPPRSNVSLLALIERGKYMHLLGPEAQAANWSPTGKNTITYVTQANKHTHLWTVGTAGYPSKLVATMNTALIVQHLFWSPDGQKLALLATPGTASSSHTETAGARALYVMDAKTHDLQQVTSAQDTIIKQVTWSPNQHYLTYEQADSQGKTTLHIFDMTTNKMQLSLSFAKPLMGWSWSPDSRALVYSDGSNLHVHVFEGTSIKLPTITGSQSSPFWLKDGRILYLHRDKNVAQLAFLMPPKAKA